jgi:AraC-like DNA-binding protein
MGLSSHLVENFGRPFVLVDELVFLVPAGSVLDLTRRHLKFLFVLHGECRHEIDRLPSSTVLREGDILFAPTVRFHRYINPAPRKDARVHMLRLFLHPDAEAGKVRRPRHDPDSLARFVRQYFPAPIHLRGAINPEMRACLQLLRRETEHRGTGFRHRVHALCTELVVLTARAMPRPAADRRAPVPPTFVESAKEYILKHFHDPDLRLGAIAHHAGKGDEHLARQFRRHTGQSVFEFVRDVRVHHAKTLLLDPSQSLTTIARLCGFNSLAFFSRTFRQVSGHAPSHYREQLGLKLRAGPPPIRR